MKLKWKQKLKLLAENRKSGILNTKIYCDYLTLIYRPNDKYCDIITNHK